MNSFDFQPSKLKVLKVESQLRWLNINGIDSALPILIPLIPNHLKRNPLIKTGITKFWLYKFSSFTSSSYRSDRHPHNEFQWPGSNHPYHLGNSPGESSVLILWKITSFWWRHHLWLIYKINYNLPIRTSHFSVAFLFPLFPAF